MAPQKRLEKLRAAGVNPTMQRLAILEFLEGTLTHPTAEEVYAAVHKAYPTIARATVYNTLEALTRAGTILKLAVDSSAARYDADLRPHVHFRCRLCGKVYDLEIETTQCLSRKVEGHDIEALRTYAFGVCASCRDGSSDGAARGDGAQRRPARAAEAGAHPRDTRNSSPEPRPARALENAPKGRPPKPSDRAGQRRKTDA